MCDEVIKEVGQFGSNCLHVLPQALLLLGSAVDITHFVYNSLIAPAARVIIPGLNVSSIRAVSLDAGH